MSPARSRRTPVPHSRDRREVIVAVAIAAGIVIGTVLLIWLMRPDNGQDGTGGLFTRQPRATLLVVLGLAAFAFFAWWILKGSTRRRENYPVILAVGGFATLGLVVLAGFFWPGGLLRHPAPPPPSLEELQQQLNATSTSAPAGETSSTTPPGAESSSTTVAPTTTTGSP